MASPEPLYERRYSLIPQNPAESPDNPLRRCRVKLGSQHNHHVMVIRAVQNQTILIRRLIRELCASALRAVATLRVLRLMLSQ